MVRKKTTNEEVKPTYTKSALLTSERFIDRTDLIDALLVDDEVYTVDDVEKYIADYLKKGV